MSKLISRGMIADFLRGRSIDTEADVKHVAVEFHKMLRSHDVVSVVRCQDCFYANPFFGDDYVRCAVWGEDIRKDGYCYCGKRKKGEE